jgi:hypothetical protein
MCIGPEIIAALSIAQATMGFVSASANADAQNKQHRQNQLNVISSYQDEIANRNARVVQEREAASAALLDRRLEGLRSRATATVASGEAGVTGLSVNALLNDFLGQEGRAVTALQTNFENRHLALRNEGEASFHRARGRIFNVPTAAPPSPLPYMIQAATGAVNAYRPNPYAQPANAAS